MYFKRDEKAIEETALKYGQYCFSVAINITGNKSDAEECVNDTYVGVWNAIPPTRPNNLMAFVCKIARNFSLKRLEFMKREKRSANILILWSKIKILLYFKYARIIIGYRNPHLHNILRNQRLDFLGPLHKAQVARIEILLITEIKSLLQAVYAIEIEVIDGIAICR